MPRAKHAHKPGYKTTEFWVTVLTVVGSIATASVGIVPNEYAALVTAFAQAAYVISRGIAKSGHAGIVKSEELA